MLQLVGVKKKFANRHILDVRELFFDPGFHCIRGENGSGKTTLLRILAGLLPFEGDVLLNGISLKRQGLAYRQNIGWAEADPVYPAFLRGKDLVRLYQNIRHVSETDMAGLIHTFHLENMLDRPCGAYSAGTIKRLSLVLAFAGNPSCILLDEPMSTLDTDIAGALSCLMTGIHDKNGSSFIYSSHQLFPLPGIPDEKTWSVSDQTIEIKK